MDVPFKCERESSLLGDDLPSTSDASTVVVEEVIALGASALSLKVGTSSDNDVEGSSDSSSPSSKPYSSSSTKMLSSISLSPTHSKISR
jgi:hypothetical protein